MAYKLPVKKRFHINEKGEPGICVAAIKCRFGGEGDHYPTELDARQAFERKMTFRSSWQAYKDKANLPDADVTELPEGIIVAPDKILLPAGDYFIGDPYQTVGVDEKGWNDWVATVDRTIGWENDVADYREEQNPAVGALYNGKPVVGMKAGLGDGIYWSVSPTKRCASDVGLIGAVPIDLVREDLHLDLAATETSSLAMAYRFHEPTLMERDTAGNVRFGNQLLLIHSATLSQSQLDQFVLSETHWQHGQSSGMEEKHFEFYEKLANQFHERTR